MPYSTPLSVYKGRMATTLASIMSTLKLDIPLTLRRRQYFAWLTMSTTSWSARIFQSLFSLQRPLPPIHCRHVCEDRVRETSLPNSHMWRTTFIGMIGLIMIGMGRTVANCASYPPPSLEVHNISMSGCKMQ